MSREEFLRRRAMAATPSRVARGPSFSDDPGDLGAVDETNNEGGDVSRKFSQLVFNEAVVGTTAVYTSSEFNEMLARADMLALSFIGDQVSGTTPTAEVRVEHSSDQRNWATKNATAEITATTLVTTGTNVFNGYEPGTIPSNGFVRLKVTLAGTGPVVHAKIYVTGRDRA